jgi:hypothetical protein
LDFVPLKVLDQALEILVMLIEVLLQCSAAIPLFSNNKDLDMMVTGH